jgi:hypothetical protein
MPSVATRAKTARYAERSAKVPENFAETLSLFTDRRLAGER